MRKWHLEYNVQIFYSWFLNSICNNWRIFILFLFGLILGMLISNIGITFLNLFRLNRDF